MLTTNTAQLRHRCGNEVVCELRVAVVCGVRIILYMKSKFKSDGRGQRPFFLFRDVSFTYFTRFLPIRFDTAVSNVWRNDCIAGRRNHRRIYRAQNPTCFSFLGSIQHITSVCECRCVWVKVMCFFFSRSSKHNGLNLSTFTERWKKESKKRTREIRLKRNLLVTITSFNNGASKCPKYSRTPMYCTNFGILTWSTDNFNLSIFVLCNAHSTAPKIENPHSSLSFSRVSHLVQLIAAVMHNRFDEYARCVLSVAHKMVKSTNKQLEIALKPRQYHRTYALSLTWYVTHKVYWPWCETTYWHD